MLAEFQAALQSAKALSDIAKASRGLANYNELATAVSDVNVKLMAATAIALSAQEKQAAQNSRINHLEDELNSCCRWRIRTMRVFACVAQSCGRWGSWYGFAPLDRQLLARRRDLHLDQGQMAPTSTERWTSKGAP
jgi:hypothetical protein